MSTELVLDVCTPEGKTWLARLTGVGGPAGFQREFYRYVAADLSRSGKTGIYTYVLDDGIFESNEGRRRYGRKYWRVQAGEITEIDRADAVKALS